MNESWAMNGVRCVGSRVCAWLVSAHILSQSTSMAVMPGLAYSSEAMSEMRCASGSSARIATI